MNVLPQNRNPRGRPKKTKSQSYKDVFSELGLTTRQIMYVMERFNPDNHDNKQLAFKNAGFEFKSKIVANAAISRLENQPNIKEAFKKYIEWVMDSEKDKLQLKILKELQTQAFYDPMEFFEANGNLKPLDKIPAELRGCVIQIDTKAFGKDAHEITNYKLVDKQKALKELISYMALAQSSGEVSIRAKGGKAADGGSILPTINISVG